MAADTAIRDHVRQLLDWKDAHVGFDAAVAGVPAAMRGAMATGAPHSIWQLVEHIRITQHDILEFCRNPAYRSMKWPDDYWPPTPAPPADPAWTESLSHVRADRAALQRMASDPATALTARVPHGSGQTYLREFLLVADHTAYHVGQIVIVRRLLGAWSRE
ncbi:MAG TPA: DinB family protein [Vicinamibacterales bacterium]|jgi:uncharacterized damage-inducible protein DinB